MFAGILAGMTWAVETILLGIALSMNPLCSTPQAMALAPFVSTFLHDLFSALCLCIINGVRGRLPDVAAALKTKNGRFAALAAIVGGPVGMTGYTEDQIGPVTLDYYTSTFENVYEITLPNPHAVRIAELMREKARYAVIATMPVFTAEAVEMRMAWVGLKPGMFDFITTADTSSYCKPNPLYFQEILDRFGAAPEETLMIGNDVREDMRPCGELGIDVFLVTNHMITHDLPYDEFRSGTYEELVSFLEEL